MVEVIIGRAGVGKTFHCLQRAKKILDTEPLRTEIIFLLPAYQTYRAELELAALTGGALNTRMNSFGRFARQILDEIGGALAPKISEIGRRLLLRKILLKRDKSGELKYFTRAAKQHGFAEILSDGLKELRNYSLDAEKLDEAADKIDNTELRDKLHDLKLLAQDFRDALTDKLTDDENLLERATEFMEQSPTISDAEIFIDGFIFFDPQQRNFLRKLFACARNVHVTLPMDTNLNSRENLSEVGTFNRAFETFKTLKTLAAEAKADFNITRLETPRRFKLPALKILEQRIFDYAPQNFDDSRGLKVVEAVNARAEVEFVAREILRLVKAGYRLRDIGILVREEKYFSLVKPLFEIHAIPFFVDKKRAATNHPLAELIRSALEILRGWRRESVFRCLRTGFFDAEQQEIDLLENYVIEFGLKGAATWQRSWDFRRVKNLDSPFKVATESEVQLIERVNAVRKKVSAPLIKFSERVKNSEGNVVKLTTALFNLLEDLNVHEKLSDWSQAEELRGNLALSKEHVKIWDDAVNLFEQVVDALGDEKIPTREFEAIIGEGLDALQMSLIPPGLDEVTVAQFEQNSLQNSRAIFVLGFTDEYFPRKVYEKDLLSDADRLRLNEAGTEIPRGGREQALAEKFLIYRGLTQARELLIISYPLAGIEGEKISASTLLNKIRTIFPDVPTERVELDVLRNIGSEIFAAGEKNLSQETAQKLYAPSRKMRTAVTKVESFNECPFKFFAEHGLNLQERAEYTVQAPDIGNILHAVMSRFGRSLQEENRAWSSVANSELPARVEKILDELTPFVHNKILHSTKTLEHRRERIKKVAVESLSRLIDLDKASDFSPQIFEANFHEDKKISDVAVDLNGRIDRIDLSNDGKYFLIIDYKTGKASLSLKKIFGGLSLQLAIYLSAAKNLAEVGEREPGAMLYCLLKVANGTGRTEVEVSEKAADDLKMPGLIRVDDNIKDAVDSTENFVEFKKDNLVDREELQTIIAYAEKILETTAEKILNGYIEVKPAKFGKDDACEYCPFTALCNFDRAVNETSTPIDAKSKEIIAMMNDALTDGDKS